MFAQQDAGQLTLPDRGLVTTANRFQIMPDIGALKCCPNGQWSILVRKSVFCCRARREKSARLGGMALAL